MNESLLAQARLYASCHQLEIGAPLGSGKDGIVMAAKRNAKPAEVAIKVHRFDELYQREKEAYGRLKTCGISKVRRFHVPQFIASDDILRVIQMTIVARPFVLDFAAAYLDKRPDFSEEIWADWEKSLFPTEEIVVINPSSREASLASVPTVPGGRACWSAT
jgi:hypothetical protein